MVKKIALAIVMLIDSHIFPMERDLRTPSPNARIGSPFRVGSPLSAFNEGQGVGSITVFSGPVFSGKSEELMRIIRRIRLANLPILVFKPELDSRSNAIISRARDEIIEAITINDPEEIWEHYKKNPANFIAIDGVQFIKKEIVNILKKLRAQRVQIFAAGLDTDFKGNSFGKTMPELFSNANEVVKLQAVCARCKRLNATLSQSLVDGHPSRSSDDNNEIHNITYEPRCIECHGLDGKCDSPTLNALANETGSLTVFCGPMCAGKSEELMRIIRLIRRADLPILVFKPDLDTRSKGIKSRGQDEIIEATAIKDPEEIWKLYQEKPVSFIAIDEVQFCKKSIIDIINRLIAKKVQIFTSGLELDFKRESFGKTMQKLLGMADTVVKLKAVCSVCKSFNALLTQRLVDNKPAHRSDPLIIVDDGKTHNVTYEPRCRKCHELPD